ncbi:hypothetical protein [Pseudomonas sp. LRF_L74]|uniref:hypothetical protein n=1 Tax=Pseudomonas sp. LRF_L74 TaxID=3369422 RepID=UPI003F5D8344
MWTDRILGATLAAAMLLLGGCETELRQPAYSPHYQVNLGRHSPFADACLERAGEGASAQLPPGCANALNLMRMVERSSELQQGTEPAPAMAAPVGHALQRYLDPDAPDEQKRREWAEQDASAGSSGR